MGYVHLLEALADENHADHEMYMEWSGPVDPEEFDVTAVNERLARL